MFNNFLKNLSILKKFLFINFIIFAIIMVFTLIYLNTIQPNLISKKKDNHVQIINNTIAPSYVSFWNFLRKIFEILTKSLTKI